MAAAPPTLSLALKFLREAAGLSQHQVQALTGVSASLLSHYEKGDKHVARALLDRIAMGIGYDAESVELAVFAASALVGSVAGAPASPAYPSPAERHVAERAAAVVAGAALTLTRAAILRQAREARVARAHDEAERQWGVLKGCTTGERRLLIERSAEYRNWALGVRLGEESTRAAARNLDLAAELAGLALTAAELAEGDDAWRSRLAGRARGFVGNALRVKGSLRAAEAELARAWKLWDAGAPGDPDRILPEWRLPDLEASLRRDLREFERALALLDRAQALAPPEAVGRILLKRAFVLEQAGEVARAVGVLRQAAPRVRGSADGRLYFGVRFQLAVNLCHLGQFGEAETQLPELRKLSASLGSERDAARVRWLTGRVAAGRGRPAEARTAFEEARAFFATDDAYDFALVSLDLAALHLEGGNTGAVRDLALTMAGIFHAEGITREVLAALRVFCAAALQERATLAEVRAILTQVRQAGGRL